MAKTIHHITPGDPNPYRYEVRKHFTHQGSAHSAVIGVYKTEEEALDAAHMMAARDPQFISFDIIDHQADE